MNKPPNHLEQTQDRLLKQYLTPPPFCPESSSSPALPNCRLRQHCLRPSIHRVPGKRSELYRTTNSMDSMPHCCDGQDLSLLLVPSRAGSASVGSLACGTSNPLCPETSCR